MLVIFIMLVKYIVHALISEKANQKAKSYNCHVIHSLCEYYSQQPSKFKCR